MHGTAQGDTVDDRWMIAGRSDGHRLMVQQSHNTHQLEQENRQMIQRSPTGVRPTSRW